MNWDEIKALYEKAGECLWNIRKASCWSIDYENGYYYLFAALREARLQTEKNHLTYARILASCAYNRVPGRSEYDVFHKYIHPAYEEYQLALKEAGEQPTEKELDRIRLSNDSCQYKLDHEDTSEDDKLEAALALIENHQLLEQFNGIFYDSKFIAFDVDEQVNTAILKLKYNEYLFTLRFDILFDTYLSCDPITAYVGDFCCYREWHNADLITFNIGFLKVTCKKITVIEVTLEDYVVSKETT